MQAPNVGQITDTSDVTDRCSAEFCGLWVYGTKAAYSQTIINLLEHTQEPENIQIWSDYREITSISRGEYS